MNTASVPVLAARKLTGLEWTQLRSAFDTLVCVAPELREAQVNALGLDGFLTHRLRAMLNAGAASGILDATPLAPAEAAAASPDYSSLAAGTVIGGFRVERLIGRGGMGEVYLAHRDAADFSQRVALKMIRPEAVGRFDAFTAERRMLAGLEHPGIARLIDGGIAPDGRPFMVLEYIEGQEIHRWCEDHRADLATRLRLFLEMCDAVSYAHARLVVHRDIKPANMLVDREGRARLLDFGIARLLDAGAAQRTMTHVLATPQYAAPEQFDGSPVTVATDVYALGAVLFELLVGRGPWNLDSKGGLPVVLMRLLQGDPAPPSSIADASVVASARIAGDLDAIVLKAMRCSPAHRYSSVEALADDVRRHLAFRPVRARSGARGYRLRRYLRRNRWGVAATAAIAAALIAGLIGTTWQARRAAEERNVARSEAERAEAVNQAMMLMFRDASDTSRLGTISARDLIDGTAKRLATSLPPDSPQSTAVIGALSDLYQIVENTAGAKALLRVAMTRGIGRRDVVGSAQLKQRYATILAIEHRFAGARRLMAEANRVWQSDPARFRRERVEAASTEAYMLRLEGRRAEGIALLMGNMDDADRVYADYSRDLTTRYAALVAHLTEADRLGEAAEMIRRGQAALARSHQGNSSSALTMRRIEAGIALRKGDFSTAESIMRGVVVRRRAAYGPSLELAVDMMQYGQTLNLLQRPADALTVLDRARPIAVEYLGADTRLTRMIGLFRTDALLAIGDTDAADRAFAAVSEGLRQEGPTSVSYAARLLTIARLSFAHGDIAASRVALGTAERVCHAIGPAAVIYARQMAPLRAKIMSRRQAS